MKKQILDSFLLSLLLIFIISFPLELLITDVLSYYLITIGLRLILLLYYYFAIRRTNRKIIGVGIKKEMLFMIPCFLIAFSNFSLFLIYPNNISFASFEMNKYIYFEFIIDLLTAILEEIVFRFYFHNMLRISNRLVRIIASAGIFAAFHLLNFVSTFDPTTLITVVYTFGLGIVLGFIYEFSNSLPLSILFHFLFNSVNGTLFNSIALFNSEMLIAYYVCNIVVALIVGLYLLFLFLFRYKKVNHLYFY